MTPQAKSTAKTIAIIVGIALVVGTVAWIIAKKIRTDREDREAMLTDPTGGGSATQSSAPKTTTTTPKTTSSSGSTSTFLGRTFSKLEVEKMQSCLLTMGTIWNCSDIVDAIKNTGGVDGKIGNGFTTAFNLAVEYGLISGLDALYVQATKV